MMESRALAVEQKDLCQGSLGPGVIPSVRTFISLVFRAFNGDEREGKYPYEYYADVLLSVIENGSFALGE